MSSEDIASRWLLELSLSLQRRDIGNFSNLFLPNGCLRDFLVFTWDIRTLHGHEKISNYIWENIHKSSISGFALCTEDQYFRPAFSGSGSELVSSGFTFSTPIANGRGFLELGLAQDGEYKASMLLMTLDSLKGYEEKAPESDIYHWRQPSWAEARDETWKGIEKEPQVLISMSFRLYQCIQCLLKLSFKSGRDQMDFKSLHDSSKCRSLRL